jgi:aerobic-type carbon monoxide dehydrogenase small subunit (CoxS/CutS family)
VITLHINGKRVEVRDGVSVAAAIAISGASQFRRSVTGQARAPVCGMGICMECRVTVDGVPHTRSCQLPCRDGMEVLTDA